jgi:hypothetical protein
MPLPISAMVIPECGWQHMHQDDLGIKMFFDAIVIGTGQAGPR